jgi:hypothetical protein
MRDTGDAGGKRDEGHTHTNTHTYTAYLHHERKGMPPPRSLHVHRHAAPMHTDIAQTAQDTDDCDCDRVEDHARPYDPMIPPSNASRSPVLLLICYSAVLCSAAASAAAVLLSLLCSLLSLLPLLCCRWADGQMGKWTDGQMGRASRMRQTHTRHTQITKDSARCPG